MPAFCARTIVAAVIRAIFCPRKLLLLVAVLLLFSPMRLVWADTGAPTGICTTADGIAQPCSTYSGDDSDEDTPRVYRPDPAAAARAREAAARAERQRKASQLNQEALSLHGPETRDRQIQLMEEARRLWPEDNVIRANLAAKRAYKAIDENNYADALSYIREAVQYFPTWQPYHDNLSYIEYELKGRQARETKSREARQVAGAEVNHLLDSWSAPSGTSVPGSSGTRFFGQGGNPSGLTFLPVPPETHIVNINTMQQLSSVEKDSQRARKDASAESVKYFAGCGTTGEPCQQGDASAKGSGVGAVRGSARLPENIRIAMAKDEKGGGALIRAEERARKGEAASKVKLDAIEKALAQAGSADKPALSALRANVYQEWSTAKSKADASALAVEDYARNHYRVNFTEQPAAKPSQETSALQH